MLKICFLSFTCFRIKFYMLERKKKVFIRCGGCAHTACVFNLYRKQCKNEHTVVLCGFASDSRKIESGPEIVQPHVKPHFVQIR